MRANTFPSVSVAHLPGTASRMACNLLALAGFGVALFPVFTDRAFYDRLALSGLFVAGLVFSASGVTDEFALVRFLVADLSVRTRAATRRRRILALPGMGIANLLALALRVALQCWNALEEVLVADFALFAFLGASNLDALLGSRVADLVLFALIQAGGVRVRDHLARVNDGSVFPLNQIGLILRTDVIRLLAATRGESHQCEDQQEWHHLRDHEVHYILLAFRPYWSFAKG